MGARVPTSTRAWLSSTSLVASCERLLRDFIRLNREDEIPIRVADVRQRVRDRRAQLRLGNFLIDLRDLQLRSNGVGLEVAKQRLAVGRNQRRVDAGLRVANSSTGSCGCCSRTA